MESKIAMRCDEMRCWRGGVAALERILEDGQAEIRVDEAGHVTDRGSSGGGFDARV